MVHVKTVQLRTRSGQGRYNLIAPVLLQFFGLSSAPSRRYLHIKYQGWQRSLNIVFTDLSFMVNKGNAWLLCINKGRAAVLPPSYWTCPSPVKRHRAMKQNWAPWRMKAIELSLLSVMEQEGCRRNNGRVWASLQAFPSPPGEERKVILSVFFLVFLLSTFIYHGYV